MPPKQYLLSSAWRKYPVKERQESSAVKPNEIPFDMRIIGAAVDYETTFSVKYDAKESLYVNNNAWLVNIDYFPNMALYLPRLYSDTIPGLYRTNIYGLFANAILRKDRHYLIYQSSDAMQIKMTGERLRLFYVKGSVHSHTVKIVLRDSQYGSWTENEINIRRYLSDLGTINIPTIEDVHKNDEFIFITEQMIFGRRFNGRRDWKLFRSAVLQQLMATYRAHGVRYLAICNSLKPDLLDQITVILDEKAEKSRFRNELRGVIERNGKAAMSFCYGALGPSNLAVTDAKIYFLDWKRAKEGVIAFDLLTIAMKYPGIDYLVKEIRESIVSTFASRECSFEDLMTVYVARTIVRHPSHMAVYLDFWERHVS